MQSQHDLSTMLLQKRCSSKLRVKSTMNYLRNNYHIKETIGQGGFGKVFNATRKCNNKSVALKFTSKDKITEFCIHDSTFQKIPIESALLSQCQGIPGVIRLIEIIELEELNIWCMVMERNPDSVDLFDYITDNAPLQEETAVYILNQLLHTLIGCHKAGVAHRDIKDENILIDVTTKEIRLIDFGSGHYYNEELYTDFNGTTIYSPPEWLNDGHYYVDELEAWSIGALLYNMITGEVPFKTKEEIIKCDVFLDSGSAECQDLIHGCLNKDRVKRIKLENILSHQWFQKYHLSMCSD